MNASAEVRAGLEGGRTRDAGPGPILAVRHSGSTQRIQLPTGTNADWRQRCQTRSRGGIFPLGHLKQGRPPAERSGVYWENQREQLRREPAQAFDPATIKQEGCRLTPPAPNSTHLCRGRDGCMWNVQENPAHPLQSCHRCSKRGAKTSHELKCSQWGIEGSVRIKTRLPGDKARRQHFLLRAFLCASVSCAIMTQSTYL